MNYEKIANAYRAIAKNNPKDRIEVEIGDTKQADFFPQVKLMRWDNEVNFSARLLTDTLQAPVGKGKPPVALPPTVSTVADRVVYNNGNITSNFYDLPQSDDLPEGGYEFEITLNKKPTSNVVTFSLQTKGLEFFYQPELTQEEIDQGNERPENVVGSYAVYYQNCPANYVGGKEYKTGKAFHIYRPKIQDANGAWTWGELNITDGLMTVTIPQEFLDKAVYPVTHAAGATFGFTSSGGSTIYGWKNQFDGCNATSGSGNNVANSITASLANSGPASNFKGILVLDGDNTIVTNGVGGGTATPSSKNWATSTFSTPPTLAESTTYKLYLVFSASYQNGIYYDTASGYNLYRDGSNSYTSPTNPTDYTNPYTNSRYSIYATYTAGGGPAPNTTAFFRMF